jgi:hypothetical protein
MKDYSPVGHDAECHAALNEKISHTTRRHIPEDFITTAARNSNEFFVHDLVPLLSRLVY